MKASPDAVGLFVAITAYLSLSTMPYMLPTDEPPPGGWPAFVRGLLAHTEARQEDLARRLCIRRRATISDWQRGDRTPTGPDAIVLKIWAGIVGYQPGDAGE